MKQKRLKNFALTLSVLAMVLAWILQPVTVIRSYASNQQVLNTNTDTATLALTNKNAGENVRFEAKNMLPGDKLTGNYRVEVSVKNSAVLHFHADIQPGYEKLAEVLKIEVRMTSPEEKELYDGLMKEMPKSLDYSLAKGSVDVTYEIAAYLDTSVGNEYQGKSLLADFKWWLEEANTPSGEEDKTETDLPETGDGSDKTETVGAGGTAPTGDIAPVLPLICVLICSILLLVYLCGFKYATVKKGTVESSVTAVKRKMLVKLYIGIGTMIMLILSLAITTLAWVTELQVIEDNWFETGKISVNINDGMPVIDEEELLFEPGMVIKKDFFVENDGTCDVYYKVYADNFEGDSLADMLEVIVTNGDEVLYRGLLSEMGKENVKTADEVLAEGERVDMTIVFHMPEENGNTYQELSASFEIKVDAVQAANNPNREFASR